MNFKLKKSNGYHKPLPVPVRPEMAGKRGVYNLDQAAEKTGWSYASLRALHETVFAPPVNFMQLHMELMEMGFEKPAQRQELIDRVTGEYPGLMDRDGREFQLQVVKAARAEPKPIESDRQISARKLLEPIDAELNAFERTAIVCLKLMGNIENALIDASGDKDLGVDGLHPIAIRNAIGSLDEAGAYLTDALSRSICGGQRRESKPSTG
jgi:hypothetical protein